MKNMLEKFLYAVCLSVFLSSLGMAQDVIKRIDGKSIESKVHSIDNYKIIYTPTGVEEDVTIELRLNLVNKVIFSTGYTYQRKDIQEIELYTYNQTHKNILKLDLLSIPGTTTKLTYEYLVDEKRAHEVGLLIHGLGANNPRKAIGVGIEYGYKFQLMGNIFQSGDERNASSGLYVKPEILLGIINYEYSTYNQRPILTKLTEPYGGIFMNGGYQFVVNNEFVLDFYFGMGPVFYGKKHSKYSPGDRFEMHDLPVGGGNWINESNFGLKGGIKVGFAFGDKFDARKTLQKRKKKR